MTTSVNSNFMIAINVSFGISKGSFLENCRMFTHLHGLNKKEAMKGERGEEMAGREPL